MSFFSNKLPLIFAILISLPCSAFALAAEEIAHLDLIAHWVGYTSLIIFTVAYGFVVGEEFTHMRSRQPFVTISSNMLTSSSWLP